MTIKIDVNGNAVIDSGRVSFEKEINSVDIYIEDVRCEFRLNQPEPTAEQLLAMLKPHHHVAYMSKPSTHVFHVGENAKFKVIATLSEFFFAGSPLLALDYTITLRKPAGEVAP